MALPVILVIGYLSMSGAQKSAVVVPDSAQQSRSAEEVLRRGEFEVQLPARSIGEVIDDSSLIARVRIVDAGARWNSVDGSDWEQEWELDPATFPSAPVPMTVLVLRVEDVLYEPPDSSPNVAVGDTLDALCVGDAWGIPTPMGVVPPDPLLDSSGVREQIIFLDWAPTWFAGPPGARDALAIETLRWRCDPTFGRWSVDLESGLASPQATEHAYSLESGVAAGDISAQPVGDALGVEQEELIELIELERQTPDATVASYVQWPWLPRYESDVASDSGEPT